MILGIWFAGKGTAIFGMDKVLQVIVICVMYNLSNPKGSMFSWKCMQTITLRL